jgi:arabinogalactan endo-1,4-beta-galactosidase
MCGAAGLLALPAVAASPSAVPSNFVGVTVDGPVYPDTASGVDVAQQFARMEQSGVESVRVVFDWAHAQPYASWSKVPRAARSRYTNVGGVPTDFSEMDEIVGLASGYGMTVLPTVIYAPGWDVAKRTRSTFGRPKRDQPYAKFLTALVARYGPRGSLWKAYFHKLPIRAWQIWNEPNIHLFWPTQPFARTYVALLKSAHAAIKKADPGAKVVLAGMPNYSWKDLQHIYGVAGARAAFDEVAIHPYTAKPAGVITILRKVRQVMNQNGDAAKPLIADEISWTSSQGYTIHNVGLDIATTEQGQARNIAALLPMLARDRTSLRLAGFYYYTWASDEIQNGLVFAYAGLLKYQDGTLSDKPAFGAFEHAALAMEHCKRVGSLAGSCAQR